MATRADKEAPCDECENHKDHSHGFIDTKKGGPSWANLLEESITTAYKKDSLPTLLAIPDANTSLTNIQNAFQGVQLEDSGTVPHGTTNTTNNNNTAAKTTTEKAGARNTSTEFCSATLDTRFQIGFSRTYGHAVELTRQQKKTSDEKDSPSSDEIAAIESGTYVFTKSEMPYACIVQEPWRGSVCEECLRLLPDDLDNAFICPACPESLSDQETQLKEEGTSRNMGGVRDEFGPEPFIQAPYQPALFCSRECLRAGWKSWHGYECGHADILQSVSTNKRLALRAYWKNLQRMVKVAPTGEEGGGSSTNAKSSSGSTPKRPVSSSVSSSSLSDTRPGGLTFKNERRIESTDGSDIGLDKLCSHFSELDPMQRTAHIMVGYYFQQTLGLPDDAAMEIAYLLAITMYNAFAIKSHLHGRERDSEMLRHMEESRIGMGLYLKACMFNHSCAPNALVVFGCTDPRNYEENLSPRKQVAANQKSKDVEDQKTNDPASNGTRGPDPRTINVIITKTLKVDQEVPVLIEISYGPQVGRMPLRQRQKYLRDNHQFECNCTACNDKFAETVHRKTYKCAKNGSTCRPLAEDDRTCPTCGTEVDFERRQKLYQLMVRLLSDAQDPTLPHNKRLTLLHTLESSQSKVFVNTHVLYGHTCDQLAQTYAQAGDLPKAVEWCTKAHKVILVHFPHDSIEVAQETLKLAGLLFNNSQPKEALKHVKTAIELYKGHYGAASTHPDLLELYEMEEVLVPIVEK
ncbi:SET and MYND domain-containing protein 4 [Podila epigama]|nr:SET and MYND domain-containing protein 4 [Podila epigama]